MSDQPLNVVKIAAWIPVTREILRDAGYEGPLAKGDPDAVRYRSMWHDQYQRSWGGVSGWFPLRVPPPWESPDPPIMPVITLRRRR